MRSWAIWLFAFGYLAGYAPYSALTKVLSGGRAPTFGPAISGVALLPLSTAAATAMAMGLVYGRKWWRVATVHEIAGRRIHGPSRFTFLSGVCSAGIVLTTTLAYTFEGTSIIFMMLLMRGGVLAIAPVVDLVTGRKVKVYSWIALTLSVSALVVALDPRGRFHLTLLSAIDIAVYLAAYFVRLRLMSRLAKGSDADNFRYFVEEQMVTSPVAMLSLVVLAFVPGTLGQELRRGFFEVPAGPALWAVVLVGLLSQSNGLFGGMVLLDKRENSFAVPVNRASSILAGLLASYSMMLLFGERAPGPRELLGAGLIVVAVLCLSLGPQLFRPKAPSGV